MDLHQEWRSPDFHGKGAMRFELLLLLFPLLLGVSRRRPNLVELGLSVLWLHLALTGFRYVPLWVVVAAPLLARSSMEVPWLRSRPRTAPARRGRRVPVRRSGRASPWVGPWCWSRWLLLGWAQAAEGRFARHKPEIIPAAALDRFLEIHDEWRRSTGGRRSSSTPTTGAAT